MPVVRRPTLAPNTRSDSCRSLGLQLRVIRDIANAALVALSGRFERLYSLMDHRSIPPEGLMRALLLPAFYSIHSEDEIRALLSRGAGTEGRIGHRGWHHSGNVGCREIKAFALGRRGSSWKRLIPF